MPPRSPFIAPEGIATRLDQRPADKTLLMSHSSASTSFVRSSVSVRGSIRNYDDLDFLVAQAQLVASLVIPVDGSGGRLDRDQDSLGPDPGRLRGRARDAVGRH